MQPTINSAQKEVVKSDLITIVNSKKSKKADLVNSKLPKSRTFKKNDNNKYEEETNITPKSFRSESVFSIKKRTINHTERFSSLDSVLFDYVSLANNYMSQLVNVDVLSPNVKAVANIPLKNARHKLTINCGLQSTDNLVDIIKEKKIVIDFYFGIDWNFGIKPVYDDYGNLKKMSFLSAKNVNTFSKVKSYDSSYVYHYDTTFIQGKITDHPKTNFDFNFKYNIFSLKENRKMYFNIGPNFSFGNILLRDLNLFHTKTNSVDSTYSPKVSYATSERSEDAYFKEQFNFGVRIGFGTELYIVGDKNVGINLSVNYNSKIFGKNQNPSTHILSFRAGPIINAYVKDNESYTTAVSFLPFFEYSIFTNKDVRINDKIFNFGLQIGLPFKWPDKPVTKRRNNH
ncbi:MAG: hypothetical protein IPF58_18110 [Saprospirales bacterium]|nr:hypothetical protein [Saprospirales bacterium]